MIIKWTISYHFDKYIDHENTLIRSPEGSDHRGRVAQLSRGRGNAANFPTGRLPEAERPGSGPTAPHFHARGETQSPHPLRPRALRAREGGRDHARAPD